MKSNNKNFEDDEQIDLRPQAVPTYAIKYHDYDSNENVFVTRDGKRVEFYDEVEAEEYAYIYSRCEGVYAGVVRV